MVFAGVIAMVMMGGCASSEEGHEGGVRWRVGSSEHQPTMTLPQISPSQRAVMTSDAG